MAHKWFGPLLSSPLLLLRFSTMPSRLPTCGSLRMALPTWSLCTKSRSSETGSSLVSRRLTELFGIGRKKMKRYRSHLRCPVVGLGQCGVVCKPICGGRIRALVRNTHASKLVCVMLGATSGDRNEWLNKSFASNAMTLDSLLLAPCSCVSCMSCKAYIVAFGACAMVAGKGGAKFIKAVGGECSVKSTVCQKNGNNNFPRTINRCVLVEP